MFAMCLERTGPITGTDGPLQAREIPSPEVPPGHILVRVTACGVCHTELDEIEGRTAPPRLPVIPGHQVIGTVAQCGTGCTMFGPGDRIGVSWFHSSCGTCGYCRSGLENLCPEFTATGRDADGGYAQLMVIPEASVVGIPRNFSDTEAAPLLCAGAIGYRSLRLTSLEDGKILGLTGIAPEVECYDLPDANRALRDLKSRRARGAKVLLVH